jgi:hypothetical protein
VMKNLIKKITWVLIILAALYLGINAAFGVFGKAIIISQIEKNLKIKASLEGVSFGLPLSVNIIGLEVGGLFKADSISVSPSMLGFLSGKIVLSEARIVKPEITIIKSAEGELNLPKLESKGKPPPFLLAGLKVKDGKFIFIDKKINPEGHRVVVKDINADISRAAFPPASLYTNFKVSASLDGGDGKPAGSARLTGWIDFRVKDMDGKVELMDIDGTSLAPYYQSIIAGKKLLSAKLNFTADLKAKRNDLAAKCRLEFSNIVYAKPTESTEGNGEVSDILPSILNIFSNDSGSVVFNFTVATKLDKPKIDVLSLRGSIGQAVVENAAGQPPEKMIEKIKEAAGDFKEIGKSLKEIFNKND